MGSSLHLRTRNLSPRMKLLGHERSTRRLHIDDHKIARRCIPHDGLSYPSTTLAIIYIYVTRMPASKDGNRLILASSKPEKGLITLRSLSH